MKVADCRFTWKKSPSSDIVKVSVELVTNGVSQVTDLPTTDIEAFDVTINANSSGTFKVTSFDSEGKVAVSLALSWSLGDLEDPLPATDLAFQVMGVRDVPDNPVP